MSKRNRYDSDDEEEEPPAHTTKNSKAEVASSAPVAPAKPSITVPSSVPSQPPAAAPSSAAPASSSSTSSASASSSSSTASAAAARPSSSSAPPPSASAPPPALQPNFGLSGALSSDSSTGRTVNGVLLLHVPPPESRLPSDKWRVYVFRGDEELDCWHLGRKSNYLLGRDDKVADVLLEHGSISKQHAVILFRLVDIDVGGKGMEARTVKGVKPYVIDLESTNGTFVNDMKKRIEPARYFELRSGDRIKFGESSREYVLINETTAVGTGSRR